MLASTTTRGVAMTGRWRARHSNDGDGAGPARRLPTARLGDARLWLGVALLVVSTVVGARVLSAGQDTVTVWQTTRDLATGSSAVDLAPVVMPRTLAGDRYARPGDRLDGVLRWPVAAGELLPVSAIEPRGAHPTRRVTVSVDPRHAPPGVLPGDVVDVWSTPRDTGTAASGPPQQALAGVSVAAVAPDDLGLSGEIGIVLEVPAEQVGVLVAAARGGVVDLVAVPVASQEVRS